MSSSSSEYSVFSGHHQPTKSPEKPSTFSQTCSLLSQYIKEKGNFGDLTLGMTPRAAMETPQNLITLNLLSPNPPPQVKEETKAAKLTIFYEGKVLVFDDFPAEKVEEIMGVLGRKETAQSAYGYSQNQSSIVHDLPIARKASLHRFLEKRKDRISAKAPYQTKNHISGHVNLADESIPWLGLGVKARQL